VILTAQAIKLGYRWVPVNGQRIHFWEDTWFGIAPLAVQIWDLYCICNEKTSTLAAVWVRGELRLTFRRNFSNVLMERWDKLMSIVVQVSLNEDLDALVWCYEKSGTYSSHSCYSIISYRGVKPVYILAIWSIVVPPKIHLFLWLVAYNKFNLNKKGLMKNRQCCFCNENKSVSHLFFECVVAKVLWKYVSEFLGFDIGQNYMSVAPRWIHREKFYCVNIITTAILRNIWLVRNNMVFNKQVWFYVRCCLKMALKIPMEWKIIYKESGVLGMTRWLSFLEKLIQSPMIGGP
jgi:hypothetical protein